MDLLFTKEVTDLNGRVVVSNAGIDWKVSIYKTHLVAESLSDTGDKITDVAECCTDGGGGFARSKPRIDLELLFSGLFVGNELEIEVEMLEIASEGSPWSFHFDDLSLDFDLDAFGDVHGLR